MHKGMIVFREANDEVNVTLLGTGINRRRNLERNLERGNLPDRVGRRFENFASRANCTDNRSRSNDYG